MWGGKAMFIKEADNGTVGGEKPLDLFLNPSRELWLLEFYGHS